MGKALWKVPGSAFSSANNCIAGDSFISGRGCCSQQLNADSMKCLRMNSLSLGMFSSVVSGRAGQLGGWVWSLPSLWASAAVRLVRVHQLALVKAVDVVRGANLGEVVTNNPETLTCCF